jgi:Mechanosensitive ion channel
VFAATCQEVLGSCIFLFVKHPFDIGDRVDITSEQLIVERISLLFTIFKRVVNGKTVQVPNIVLNNLWIENITRSKAMREQIPLFVHFETSFEDIKALKNEMEKFVLDKDNNRDFQPDVEVEVIGIAEMNKLELRVEIKHKSNWANEAIRAGRHSKFMCALVLALRRVPIYGPGGGDASLGSANSPSYSVAITPEVAQRNKDVFAEKKEAKRLFSSKAAEPTIKDTAMGFSTGSDLPTGTAEYQAVQSLNARSAAVDPTRDETWDRRDDISSIGDRTSMDRDGHNLDDMRGLLHRESNKGRRQQQQDPHPYQGMQGIDEQLPPRGPSTVAYSPPPGLPLGVYSSSSVSEAPAQPGQSGPSWGGPARR